MKKLKKALSLLLCAVMMLGLLPAGVLALDPLDPGAFDGAVVSTQIDGLGYVTLTRNRDGAVGTSFDHVLYGEMIKISILSASCGTDPFGSPILSELRDLKVTNSAGEVIRVYERPYYDTDNSYQYFFEMPNELDVTVKAVFRAPGEPTYTYHVGVEVLGRGTVTLDPGDTVENGKPVTVTCTPTENWEYLTQELKSVIVRDMDGNILTRKDLFIDGTFTFTMPEEDVLVTAAFGDFSRPMTYEIYTNVSGGYILYDTADATENNTVRLNWSGMYPFERDYDLLSFSAVDAYGKNVPLTLDGGAILLTMPPANVTVTATIVEFGNFPETYRVTLDPGAGGGEPVVYEASFGHRKDEAWNCEFYYDNGPGFYLFPFWCPDTFTAPEDYVFAGWEGNTTFNALGSPNTTFTAKWEYDWSQVPTAQCEFEPGSVTLNGAGETTFDFTAVTFNGGKVRMNGEWERVEKVLACFAGSVVLSDGENELRAVLTGNGQDTGFMFSYYAEDQVNAITLSVDPYAFEAAVPGVYTGNLLYSTQWYLGNDLKGTPVDHYLPVTIVVPEKRTVTFDPCGGTVGSSQLQTDRSGKLSELPAAEKTGFGFRGWFTAANGGEKVTVDTVYAENTTVYAHWYGPSSFTLALPNEITLTDGGEFAAFTVNVSSMTLYENEEGNTPAALRLVFESGTLENAADPSVTLPFRLSTIADFAVAGSLKTRDWATDEVGTEQTLYACVSADDWYAAAPGTYHGTLSCTARWGYETGGEIVWSSDVRTQNVLVSAVVTPTYRISVSASPAPGGTLTGGGRYGQMESVTVTATPGENYEFVGWTENGVYVSYQTSYEFSASADRELVAVFNPLRYIVILDPGDGTGDSLLYDIAYQVEIPQKDQAQPGEFYYEADGSVGFRLPQDCPDGFAAPGIDLFGGWENAGEYAALTTAETTFTASWRRRIEVDYRFLGDPSLISVELCQCERLLDYSQTFEYWGAEPLSDGKAFLGWDVGVTIRLNDGLPAQSFVSYYSYTTADNAQCVGSTRVLQLTPENPSYRLHFGFLGDAPLRITVAVSPLKVTFDGNGGSHATFFSNTTYDRYVSANYPSALPENEFSRRGYLFTGWNTQPDGSGVSYADGETVTFSAETTLYAQWVELYSISTDGNVSVYRADDDWLSTPLTEALEGEELKIVMNDPDQRQVGSGKYFTGEFSLNGVGLGFENAEYGWPNYEFTMPAQAVTVRAVQADKIAYTVDLTAGAVTLPMQAFNLLAMDMDENASSDPDTDDMLYDLNGGGVPDARIHIEEQFDNEGNWIGMTAALSSEPDADAAGKYVYYYAHDPDLPYGSITVILPVTDSFDFFPAHSLTIREDIGVNFYLDLAHFDLQDARVEFSWGQKKDGSGPHTATVSLAGMTPVWNVEVTGLYRVSVRVAAKEMTDTITATLYFGEEAIRSDTYSVVEYASMIFRNSVYVESNPAKRPLLQELCRTMLLYGAAAQTQFGYNADQIVNLSRFGVSDSLEPVNYSHLISCLNHLLDNDEYALTVVGTSLLLRSKTICRLLFRPDPDTDWSGCVLRAIYPDNSMLIIPAAQGSAGLVCFDVPVGAKDLMQDILLHYGTLDSRGNFDNAGSFGICNAGAYMREAWEGSDSTTRNLFTALYRYSEAAKAYAAA